MTASTIRRSRPTRRTGPSSRARFVTDADGRFFFRTILPCSYPIPTDGPVGEMIMQTKRHPMRPAHVHFLVNAQGYEPLITHVFIDGDKYLDSDVVFGVKDELIAKIEKRSDAGDAGRQAGGGTVASDDLRIPHEAGRRHRAEADGGEGGRSRLKELRWSEQSAVRSSQGGCDVRCASGSCATADLTGCPSWANNKHTANLKKTRGEPAYAPGASRLSR